MRDIDEFWKKCGRSFNMLALSKMGHTLKGSKVTGTASLKDILYMNDAFSAIGAIKMARKGFRQRILEGQEEDLREEIPHYEIG